MLRALALAGLSCLLVTTAGAGTRFSRFASGFLDAGRPDLLEALSEVGGQPVLYVQDDQALEMVARHHGDLRRRFRYLHPSPARITELVDKPSFQALAERHALPVPPAVRVVGGEDPLLSQLRPPLVVKPARRDAHWDEITGGAKVLAVDDAASWRAVRERLEGFGRELIVQERIPGGEDRIETYHCYVGTTGETLGEFTGRKLRTQPAAYGASSAVVTTDAADVRALGRWVVAKLGVRGPAKIDLKRGPDGRLWLLEVNARWTLWAHLGAVAGVNLPALAHADLNDERPEPAGPARPGVRWCDLRLDVMSVRESGGSLLRWTAFAARCSARSGANLDDPMPLLRGRLWPRLAAFLF